MKTDAEKAQLRADPFYPLSTAQKGQLALALIKPKENKVSQQKIV